MIILLRLVAEMLRFLLYIQTFLCLYPVLSWFGLDGSGLEKTVRGECEMLAYPLRLLLSRFIDRHPAASPLPLIIVMSVFYCAAYCLPAV